MDYGKRERRAFKAETTAHTNSQSGVGASPERIVFSALSLKQLGALGRTGICSDKVSKLPSCNVNSSV